MILNQMQNIFLPNDGIDTSSIRVTVTDGASSAKQEYTPYQNIFNVSPDTRLYLVQEIDDEKYQILFGDNILGKKPADGSTIEVTYITTNGSAANGARNFTFSGNLTYSSTGEERVLRLESLV